MKSSLNMGKYTIFISCFCFIQSNIPIFVCSSTTSSFSFNFKIFHLQILTFSILTNRPIEDWNTSEINDMSEVFQKKMSCNPNLAKWDVSKVTSFVSTPEYEQFITCKLNVLFDIP
jgi:hypothetical protein